VFAGTVDDPFFIDLGAAFDSLNFRMGIGGVVSSSVDADDKNNYAPDAVAGFNVNTIVLEVPITWLTEDGKLHPASDKRAVIGTYGTTSRPELTVRRSPRNGFDFGPFRQVQREGNPLINELIIGTGSKSVRQTHPPGKRSIFWYIHAAIPQPHQETHCGNHRKVDPPIIAFLTRLFLRLTEFEPAPMIAIRSQ